MQHLEFSQQCVEDSRLAGCSAVSVDQHNSPNMPICPSCSVQCASITNDHFLTQTYAGILMVLINHIYQL